MCCEATEQFDLPAEVIEALAHYHRLQREHGWDWGDERLPDFFGWARFSQFGAVLEAAGPTGDWAAAVRSVIGPEVPTGIVRVSVDTAGGLWVGVGPARGAAVETIDVDGSTPVFTVRCQDRTFTVEGAVQTVTAATLRLVSPRCARWSVTDAGGGAWFPDAALRKWDFHHRPFFHGHDVTLAVPAGSLRVACARGLEFERTEREVRVAAGENRTVNCEPARLFDPAADGWYSGDLHIHLNYSGDLVCTPQDAARMQLGEGLNLANLVAANISTSMVYDREMLERFGGEDLPWSTHGTVARMGVEYRNDLLGHVHALGPSGAPTRYYAGHERSDHPEDWPPNRLACAEFRRLDATVGYPHPAFTPFPDDWSTDRFFRSPRSAEARELVADAALGLVDSVDLISPFDDEGAMFLYHRLLSCGLRLAATAGTDTFLSFAHGPGVASNPPGWGRVYAHLDDRPLSVDAFKDAIRRGRTIVTNGPWLTLDVNGHGPGGVLDLTARSNLDMRATVHGPGAQRLTLVGPDGAIAENSSGGELRFQTIVNQGPTWIAAVAHGEGNPDTLDTSVFAHTSPVFVDVGGRRVSRARDAQWCLDLLDRLETFVVEHGHFHPDKREAHLADHAAVVDDARAFYRRIVSRPPLG